MSDDKTEDATGHKLDEARKKGQFARSMDLRAAAGLAVTVAAVSATIRPMLGHGVDMVSWAASRIPDTTGDFNATVGEVGTAMLPMAQTAGLVFFAVIGASVALGLLQSGLLLTMQPLAPKPERINPFEGIKRIVSPRGLIENAKNLLKAVILITVGYYAVKQEFGALSIMTMATTSGALTQYLAMATRIAWKLVTVMVIIGVADTMLQNFQFKKSMRMSKQEIKDEYKQQEGDPAAKGRMKAMRRKLMKKIRVEGVREARVVVTNPTHYSVAISYKDDSAELPRVVAKGKGYRALVIREMAKRHKIHVLEAPPLARSLYRLVDVGKHIPPSLFLATAEILVAVQRLEGKVRQAPPPPG